MSQGTFPTGLLVHLAKISISLHIRAYLTILHGTLWVVKDPKRLQADIAKSDLPADSRHYENTPIQIYFKVYHQKMKIFG